MLTTEQDLRFLETRCNKGRVKSSRPVGALPLAVAEKQDFLKDAGASTEKWRARAAALQAQNKALKAYAHMVAHDLKEPLTALVVTSDLITEIPDLSHQELKEYMQQIRSTAYEMDGMIRNLLFFAEVEKADAPVEPLDMDWVVSGALNRLDHMVKEYTARVDTPSHWPEALGYAPWVEEIWANYLSNAMKYGGRPPHVKLGACLEADGMARFWVRDNGSGIQPEVRDRLFRSDNRAVNSGRPGHGFGLSIVSTIAEKLGGQAGVESEMGQGSLFFFTLPACTSGS
jgi:two-component system sensor histidine kinase/response regulator